MKKIEMLPAVVPYPVDVAQKIKDGKVEEVLDVRIHTVAIPAEDFDQPDKWMFPLFKRIESLFEPKLGSACMNKVALTAPLIREIRGDYKSKKLMVTVIAVDVTPVIKAESIYD